MNPKPLHSPSADTVYYVVHSPDPAASDWTVQIRISRVPFIFPDKAPDLLRVRLLVRRNGRLASHRFDAARLRYSSDAATSSTDFSRSIAMVQQVLMERIGLPQAAVVKRNSGQAYAKACIEYAETEMTDVEGAADLTYWFN